MCIIKQMDCGPCSDLQQNFDSKQSLYTKKSDQDFHHGIIKVLRAVIGNKDAWAFRQPVDEQYAPNYYKLITEPMDLGSMMTKAKQRVYSNLAVLEQDFVRMVANCEAYNGPSSQYTQYAYNIWKAFRRAVKTYLGLSVTTDEQQTFSTILNNLPLPGGSSHRNRKRRARQMHQRMLMSSLQVLFQAQEDAIRDTAAQCIYHSSFTHAKLSKNSQSLDQMILQTKQENLIFKSLHEWSAQIESSKQQVILPEQAVTVIESPVSNEWLTNYPDEQRPNYSAVLFGQLNQRRGTRRKHLNSSFSIECNNSVDSGNSSPATSTDEPPTKRSAEILNKQDTPRLVLKLSRKDNDWKPVQSDDQNDFLSSSGRGSSGESSPAESCQDDSSDLEIDGELEQAAAKCHLNDDMEKQISMQLPHHLLFTSKCQLTAVSTNNKTLFIADSSHMDEHLISFYH